AEQTAHVPCTARKWPGAVVAQRQQSRQGRWPDINRARSSRSAAADRQPWAAASQGRPGDHRGTGNLSDGATYRYWTFNQKVPGPFIRVRVGDTVEVQLKNHDDSIMMHNVDFHAVTGPGGGAKATDAAPGESRGFEFTAINPGLFVYHCAVP